MTFVYIKDISYILRYTNAYISKMFELIVSHKLLFIWQHMLFRLLLLLSIAKVQKLNTSIVTATVTNNKSLLWHQLVGE